MPRNSWYPGDENNLFSKFKGVAIAIKTIFYKENFPAKSSKLFGYKCDLILSFNMCLGLNLFFREP